MVVISEDASTDRHHLFLLSMPRTLEIKEPDLNRATALAHAADHFYGVDDHCHIHHGGQDLRYLSLLCCLYISSCVVHLE